MLIIFVNYSGNANSNHSVQGEANRDVRTPSAPLVITPGAGSKIIHPPEDVSLVSLEFT